MWEKFLLSRVLVNSVTLFSMLSTPMSIDTITNTTSITGNTNRNSVIKGVKGEIANNKI